MDLGVTSRELTSENKRTDMSEPDDDDNDAVGTPPPRSPPVVADSPTNSAEPEDNDLPPSEDNDLQLESASGPSATFEICEETDMAQSNDCEDTTSKHSPQQLMESIQTDDGDDPTNSADKKDSPLETASGSPPEEKEAEMQAEEEVRSVNSNDVRASASMNSKEEILEQNAAPASENDVQLEEICDASEPQEIQVDKEGDTEASVDPDTNAIEKSQSHDIIEDVATTEHEDEDMKTCSSENISLCSRSSSSHGSDNEEDAEEEVHPDDTPHDTVRRATMQTNVETNYGNKMRRNSVMTATETNNPGPSAKLRLELIRIAPEIPKSLNESICSILLRANVSAVDLLHNYDATQVFLLFPQKELQKPIFKWQMVHFEKWKQNELINQTIAANAAVDAGNVVALKKALFAESVPRKGRLLLIFQKDREDNAIINRACLLGKLEIVKFLLRKTECDVDSPGTAGRTPIFQAAMKGHVAVVKYLIEHKADLNARDSIWGALPIHAAAEWGNVETVRLFLYIWPDLLEATTSHTESTPLLCAVEGSNLKVIQYLINKKANIDARDSTGRLAIHFAAHIANVETIKYLLSKKPDWLEARDHRNGRTPLLHAAAGGNLAGLKFLLERKADIDESDFSTGALAIHLACAWANADVVKQLLSVRPEWLEIQDERDGQMPLHWAAYGGNLAVLKLLLEMGAKVDALDFKNETALHLGAFFGHVPIVRHLISIRPKMKNKRSKDGITALEYAKHRKHPEIVKLLK